MISLFPEAGRAFKMIIGKKLAIALIIPMRKFELA
jgi:hypothetical protein